MMFQISCNRQVQNKWRWEPFPFPKLFTQAERGRSTSFSGNSAVRTYLKIYVYSSS